MSFPFIDSCVFFSTVRAMNRIPTLSDWLFWALMFGCNVVGLVVSLFGLVLALGMMWNLLFG